MERKYDHRPTNTNVAEAAPLRQSLQARRAAIAERWYRAVARTGFPPISPVDVRRELGRLVEQLIDALLAEPVERAKAHAIGAALADLHYLSHETLSRTQATLAQQMLDGLSAEQILALHPRLTTLLSELAGGYFKQARTMILDEQERANGAFVSALRESEARFRAIFEGAGIGVALVDMAGRPIVSNPALQEMLGYSADELAEMVFPEFTHPEDVATDMRHYAEVVAGQRSRYQLEKRYLRKDGQILWGRLTVSLVRDGAGAPQYAIAMVEDMTERKQMEADLARAHGRLAEQAYAERLRLAYALHDGAVQRLLDISFELFQSRNRLSGAGKQPGGVRAEAAVALDTIRQEVLDVVTQLRGVIGELRPPGLDELGLTRALEGYVARLQRERGAEAPAIDLDLEDCGTTLPPAIALCLFQAAQEALRNAIQHARARKVTITLRLSAHEVTLNVRDDGIGFHVPAQLGLLTRANHFGLVGIAERVAAAGGQFVVRSELGNETEVIARIPLQEGGGT